MLWSWLLCVITLVATASCSNILAIIPAPFFSHQIAFTQIWRELSLRGHQVTLVTTVPQNDPNLVNLTEIDMSDCFKIVTEKYQISKTAENVLNMWNWYDIFAQINRDAADKQMSDPRLQELIHNRKTTNSTSFLWNRTMRSFWLLGSCMTRRRFSSLLWRVTLSSIMLWVTQRIQIMSTLYSLYVSYFEAFHVGPGKQRIIDKYFTNMTMDLNDLISNVDMMFLDVNPIIQDARAIGPTTINIGMERRLPSKRPLTNDLKDFMDNAKEGFIYLSLGSNVKSRELNKASLTAIIEALRDVPYKVVWKFEASDLPGKPNNVKIVTWAPQQTVLKHPNIKLFITQGGLQSMEEAVYSKVPMVVIPFFFDQFHNARIMELKDIGITIGRKPSVKKEQLKSAILEVINNPKYRNSIRRLGRLAKDFPMTGLEKAIWWTEYILRNKGAKQLRNPTADVPFYQYFLLDVIGFLLAITLCILTLLYVFIKKIVHILKGIFHVKVRKGKKIQ
ncbi:hypothetical protein NQ318_021895 [Aromia moschata]|uniref:UDP-glucuronosyltransferase n=1 Tax=Aromia moschata TaxID=1265417 RepID=A0AAV8Z9D2_9CUCU|nr:hypothetical protein NQ318_021895 [Aromia moschata]